MKKRIANWMRRHGFLLRLLFSALVFVMIPVLVITMVLVNQAYGNMQAMQYEAAALESSRMAGIIDDYTRGMAVSAIRIMINRKLSYEFLQQQTYNEVEGIETIANLKLAMPFAEEAGILYSSIPILYTSRGKYIPRTYAEKILEADAEEFNTTILAAKTAGFIACAMSADTTVYYCPGSLLPSSNGQMGVIFLITKDLLYSFLEMNLPDDYKVMAIYDVSGRLIFGSGDLPGELPAFEIRNFGDTGRTAEYSSIGDSILFSSVSPLGYKVITATQTELFMQKVEVFRNSILLVAGSMAMFCILLILVMAWINYLPVDKLLLRLTNKQKIETGSLENTGCAGELETIYTAIEKYATEKEVFSRELSEQHNVLAAQLFEKLLGGAALTDRERSALGFEGAFYFAAAADHTGFTKLNAMREALLPIINDRERLYILEKPFEGYILFICALESRESDARLAYIRDLRAALHVDEVFFGIGSASVEIEGLCRSYLEAACALEWCSDGESVICFDTWSENSITFPYELITHLGDFVSNEHLLLSELDELFSRMDREKDSLLIQRHFCFKLLAKFDQTVARMNSEMQTPSEEPDNTFKSVWYTRILNSTNKLEMRNNLRLMLVEYYTRERQLKHEFNEMKSSEIIDFVNNNFTDPDLGLELLCSRFNVMDYTVSRIFREKTGSSFRKYLISRRIEYAKELMITTNANISDIAIKTGFSSLSYFTRIFKSIEGTTTSAYRKQSLL